MGKLNLTSKETGERETVDTELVTNYTELYNGPEGENLSAPKGEKVKTPKVVEPEVVEPKEPKEPKAVV